MKISKIDSSNYLKGLMLLIRKDHTITSSEFVLLMRIGKSLGFEPEFCERTINEILHNKFVEDTPPVFAEKELVGKFIRDGLTVIFSDNIIHQAEEDWLIATTQKNGIEVKEYHRIKESFLGSNRILQKLEVDDLIVSQ